MRNARRIIAAVGILAGMFAARPSLAVGTVLLANGGKHFTAYGPSTYWKFDWGQGYCGRVTTCGGPPPTYVHWTYVSKTASGVNGAYWKNPYPVWSLSYASAYVPARNATATVDYTLTYGGVSRHVKTVDQMAYYNQWVQLNASGLYAISQVHLGDQTWWGTASDKVAFDEIKIENRNY